MIVKHNKAVGDSVEWLNDAGRTHFWQQKIKEIAVDKTVMEVGANAGLLMYYSLKSGAKKVIGVEIRTQRCQFLKTLFNKLGYKNFEIINDDFFNVDLKKYSPDIILLEQIGDQFQTNNSYLQQVRKIKSELSQVKIIPDEYQINFYVFDGKVDIEDFIIPNHTLDTELLNAWKELSEVHPSDIFTHQIHHNQKIEFILDLTGYKDATVYIDNPFYYNKERVPCWTGHLCWDIPKKLYVQDCKSKIKFIFDNNEWSYFKI